MSHEVEPESPEDQPRKARSRNGKGEGSEGTIKDIAIGSAKTFIGVLLALAVNIWVEHHKDAKVYENTLKSIKFEAVGNTKILAETFDPDIFGKRPVFRDLNMKIVESSLSNNTFVERADPRVIEELVSYMNELKRLNAHRSGLEKLYFVPDSDRNAPNRRLHLIERMRTNEIGSCSAQIHKVLML